MQTYHFEPEPKKVIICRVTLNRKIIGQLEIDQKTNKPVFKVID